MKKLFYSLLILSISFLSCQDNAKPVRTAPPPRKVFKPKETPIIAVDNEQLANVFKKFDGTWKGNYVTIKDIDPLLRTSLDLENLKLEYVTKPGLTLMNNLEAEHVFTSKTPYLQELSFYDFYPKDKKTSTSDGTNKVENGRIYRTVKNLNETITYEGMVKNDSTLIWRFRQDKPQKIEYYQETVSGNFIEVIGYTYDELERLDLGPKTWFYGKFVKN